MYKMTCYFVVFPNTVEKCWSVYHLLDRWLPCGVTQGWNCNEVEAIRIYQKKKHPKGMKIQCTGF